MDAAVAGDMEAAWRHERLASGEVEVNEEPERPRGGEEDLEEAEERVLLDALSSYRRCWTRLWSEFSGDVEKRTELGPMRYTEEPVPRCATLIAALEVLSFQVTELNGSLRWPIDVFGFISVRDTLDRNRNYIFERTRDNCQTLTAEDSLLVLTGPSRGVVLIDPVEFEVELRVKGTRPSEDKVLSAEVFGYICRNHKSKYEFQKRREILNIRSTIEFKYAELGLGLEATIKVRITEGLTEFCGRFIARAASIYEDVILLDSRDKMVAISNDGAINFSRSVVVVEGHDDVLVVGVHARQSGDENPIYACRKFAPIKSGRSHDTIDVGFCKMSVEVAWSLMFS